MWSVLSLSAALLSANPYLDEGRELYKALQHEQALPRLQLAAEVPGQTLDERRAAFDLLARCKAALGDLPGAQAAYSTLLRKDALAPAPADAAPKIREAFRAAKASLFPPGTVQLRRRRGADGVLLVDVFDPWAVVVSLRLHQPGEAPSVRELSGQTRVKLAVRTTAGWVEALDESGATVGTLGSASKPVRLRKARAVAAAEPSPSPEPAPPEEDEEDAAEDTPVAATEPPAPSLAPTAPEASPPAVAALLQPAPRWRTPVAVTAFSLSAVAAGVGVGLGLSAEQHRREVLAFARAPVTSSSQREGFELASRQRVEAVAANSLYGVAGGMALTGALIWLLGPSGEGAR